MDGSHSGEESSKPYQILSWEEARKLAFRILLKKYPARREDCEEASQQMVLRSLEAKSSDERYHNLQPSPGWAATVAYRCMIDICRREGGHDKVELLEDMAVTLPHEDSGFFSGPFIELAEPEREVEDVSADEDSEVEYAILARRDAVELLDRILSSNEAVVMKLTTWHEWSSQKISNFMKVPPGTVRFWRAQALDKLRKHFGLKTRGKSV